MVKKTWQLAELHGCWWAYEGELPPPEAFTTYGRPRHLPILGPFPTRAMAEAPAPAPSFSSRNPRPRRPLCCCAPPRAMAMTDARRRWFFVLGLRRLAGKREAEEDLVGWLGPWALTHQQR